MPGDPVSEDGQLATAMNVAKDNEIDCSIIEQPVSLFAFDDIKDKDGNTVEISNVIFIHANNGYKHYIVVDDLESGYIFWVDAETKVAYPLLISFNGEITAINAMGDTVIFNDEDGLRYIKWNNETKTYTDLGQKPPMVNIRFGLQSEMKCYPGKDSDVAAIKSRFYTDEVPLPFLADDHEANAILPPELSKAGRALKNKADPFLDFSFDLSGKLGTAADSKDAVDVAIDRWTAGIMSYVNKFMADIAEDQKFCMPFFVRYAFEMYDGSMMMHSYPVYMVPSGRGVFFGLDGQKGITLTRRDSSKTYEKIDANFYGRVYGVASKLVYSLEHTNRDKLKEWKDLIKSVGIYVTPPIYTHKQGGKVTGWLSTAGSSNTTDIELSDFYSEGNVKNVDQTKYERHLIRDLFPNEEGKNIAYNKYIGDTEKLYDLPDYIMRLEYLNDTEYEKAVSEASQFFRVGGIEFDELVKQQSLPMPTAVIDVNDKTAVSALTSAQQMKDDYHTHDVVSASVMDVYNHRLNIGNVSRMLHNPISPSLQMPYLNNGTNTQWKMAVYSKAGDTENILVSEIGQCDCGYPNWMFFPDSKAYKMVLERKVGTETKKFEFKLKEHKLLEGAYNFIRFASFADEDIVFPSATANHTIHEPGYIYTSDVENPFIFPASGVNQIGDGTVKAMAQAVQALSEGQFGVHPMYAFTDQGVWALTPSPEGAWRSVQPVTRDVIAEGTMPLSIDTSVIFVSGRGVMLLSGSTTRVIDNAIQGEWKDSFASLANVVKAWDNDSPIPDLVTLSQGFCRIGSNTRMVYDYRHQRVYFCCGKFSWVLNLKTWAWTQSQTKVSTPLNSYPGCEFVTDGQVYSLDGDGRYPMAVMLTRPIKTAGEMLAKVRGLVVRGNVPSGTPGVVATALFGSRDWHNNALVATSTRPRITRIGGSGCRTHSLLVMMRDQEKYKTLLERAVIDIQEVQYDKCR